MIRLSFYIVPESQFARQLFETTGSDAFVMASKNLEGWDLAAQSKTEHELLKKLGLPFIPPALRETPENLFRIKQSGVPDLLQLSDIKGLIHAHSNWSDGGHAIRDMAEECIRPVSNTWYFPITPKRHFMPMDWMKHAFANSIAKLMTEQGARTISRFSKALNVISLMMAKWILHMSTGYFRCGDCLGTQQPANGRRKSHEAADGRHYQSVCYHPRTYDRTAACQSQRISC